jgi:hypothetical protein
MRTAKKPLLSGAKHVFRIHLRPADSAEVKADAFCIEKGIVGFGWPIKNQTSFTDHKVYRAAAKRQYVTDLPKKEQNRGYKKAMNALLKTEDNDLIWTRTRDGRYYVGRVYGPWQYNTSGDHLKADICNYKQCEWVEIGTVSEVIGTIINRFIGRATLTQVHSYTALDFSIYCWNNHKDTKTRFTFPDWKRPNDLLELITPEDCEDIVGLYLQHLHGYLIIPSTNKLSTANYEYELLHPEAGKQPAVIQVKQGGTAQLKAEDYQEISKTHHVFLFQTSLTAPLFKQDNLTFIEREEIESFIANFPHILPARVRKWINFAGRAGVELSTTEEIKPMGIKELEIALAKELALLKSVNETVKKAIEPHVTPLLARNSSFTLKGNEVVGWIGELYAATVQGGEIKSDSESYDIVRENGKKVEVKTRRQSKDGSTSWKRSGVISVDADNPPDYLIFVKLNKDYQLEEMYEFPWSYLKDEERLKEAKSNDNLKGYYIMLAPTIQGEYKVYPPK